jgi:hypothetical protein
MLGKEPTVVGTSLIKRLPDSESGPDWSTYISAVSRSGDGPDKNRFKLVFNIHEAPSEKPE